MKQIFTFTLFLLIVFTAARLHAQAPAIEWQKCLGGNYGDYAHAVEPTADGGYIVAGYSDSHEGDVTSNQGSDDYWIVKFRSNGTVEWQKSYGGSSVDKAYAIKQTADGGFIILGYSASNNGDVSGNHSSSMDFWLLKISSSGSLLWQKCLGGSKNDYGYALQLTPDGGYIVAGNSESSDGDLTKNHGKRDYWVVKLDNTGSIIWQKNYGGSGNDEAYAIQVTSDGGYIVAGRTESNDGDVSGFHGGSDFWLVKLNSVGAIQWQKCLGGSSTEWAWSVQQSNDGGYVIAGSTNSIDGDVTNLHGSASDFWIVKTNSVGDIEWQKCMGGTQDETAFDIEKTSDGGYVISGFSASYDGDLLCNAGVEDFWIVKISSGGDIQWQKSLGGNYYDEAYSIRPTKDGGYIITGLTTSTTIPGYHPNLAGEVGDYWVVKLSATIEETIPPSVSISPSSLSICPATTVILTANEINGGSNPSFHWKKNGVDIGTNSAVYSTSDLLNNDTIICTLSTAATCLSPVVSASDTVVVKMNTALKPSLSISSGGNIFCEGDLATFSLTGQDLGSSPGYQWMVNNDVAGTGSGFSTNALKNGDQVYCVAVPGSDACPNSTIYSDTLVMSVNPAHNIIINPSDTIVQSGAEIQIVANIPADVQSFQWIPANMLQDPASATPTTIPITNDIVYTLQVKGGNGCSAEKKVSVATAKSLYMPNAFTPNGDGLNDIFRIPPMVSLNLQEFSVYNRWGTKIFSTHDSKTGWDGNVGGKKAPVGTYTYLIRARDDKGEILIKGSVTLIR